MAKSPLPHASASSRPERGADWSLALLGGIALAAVLWSAGDALFDEVRYVGLRSTAGARARLASEEERLAAVALREVGDIYSRLDAALPKECYVSVRGNVRADAVTKQTQLTTHRALRQLLYPRILQLVAGVLPRAHAHRQVREFLLDLDPKDPVEASSLLREVERGPRFVLYEYEERR